jgi:hypothetical protein
MGVRSAVQPDLDCRFLWTPRNGVNVVPVAVYLGGEATTESRYPEASKRGQEESRQSKGKSILARLSHIYRPAEPDHGKRDRSGRRQ